MNSIEAWQARHSLADTEGLEQGTTGLDRSFFVECCFLGTNLTDAVLTGMPFNTDKSHFGSVPPTGVARWSSGSFPRSSLHRPPRGLHRTQPLSPASRGARPYFSRPEPLRSAHIVKPRVRFRPASPTVELGHDERRPGSHYSAAPRRPGVAAGTRWLCPPQDSSSPTSRPICPGLPGIRISLNRSPPQSAGCPPATPSSAAMLRILARSVPRAFISC